METKLLDLFRKLRLNGMANILVDVLAKARKTGVPIEDVLHDLCLVELAWREERSMGYRLRQAKLPWDWTLQSFPFKRQPGVAKSRIMSLAGLSFIQQADNIVFIGEPGTGKTGLAIGLLRNALVNGYRGRFYNAQELMDELYASLADRTTLQLLNRLCRYDLLVVDELGYLTLKPEQANAFFKLMEGRYGRRSTIITTNLAYDQWYDLFQRKPLVDALLDRLKHRCITINIDGPSLRKPLYEE